jgi:hypothetical protein
MAGEFPPLSLSILSREEVVNYLLTLQADGHTINEQSADFFIITLDDEKIILHRPYPQQPWNVSFERLGLRQLVGAARSPKELERAVTQAALLLGKDWPFKPTTGRLSADTPATNRRTISGLIGPSMIEAVFDPHLENRALATLVDILSFGSGGVADRIRLLGSTSKTTGTIPRFSKAGVDHWLGQLKITGEARVVPAKDEHRRFFLLSGGKSLLIGPSLNAIDKNEAVHLEPDTEDRAFFDKTWATATMLT